MAVSSVVHFSQVKRAFRFDAEYYDPNYLRIESKLDSLVCVELWKVAKEIRCGPFGSMIKKDDYKDVGGIPLIRVANTAKSFVKASDLVFVDEKSARDLARYSVQPGDIVVSQRGTIAQFAMVTTEYDEWIISANLISIIQSTRADFGYLLAYLNSRAGLSQIIRLKSGQVQPKIITEDVKSIKVYLPSPEIQEFVGNLIRRSYEKLRLSQSLYSEAELVLLRALRLDQLDLTPRTSYTAMFSEMLEVERLDAEYFQPKYRALLRSIDETGRAVKLSDWVREPIRRGVLPKYVEDGDLCVINSQHVGKTHVELDDNRFTTWEFADKPKNQRGVVGQFDVLLNSTGYVTIGRCQTVLDDAVAFVDGHVSVIRPRPGLDPVYLGVFLNNVPGQLQTERGWTGSSGQIELRPDVIGEYTIWKAPTEIQQEIRRLVEDSHEARKRAARLLEEAKQQVEKIVLGED